MQDARKEWRTAQNQQETTLELEKLADLAEHHLREARKELGPAWLEALLTRSTVLT